MRNNENNATLTRLLDDNRCQFLFFSMLLYFFCVLEYSNFVFNHFEYMGFRSHFSVSKALFAFLLYVALNLVLFLKSSYFIKGISALFLVLFVMPILVLFQYDSGGWMFVLSSVLLLLVINSNLTFNLPSSKMIVQHQVPIMLSVLALLIMFPFFMNYKINLDPSIFLLGEKVYAIREAIQEDGNVFTGYMKSPLIQVMLPLLAIYGLRERKVLYTVIAILLTVTMYSMIPQKSIFLGIFVVVFFYFFKNPVRKVAVFTGIVFTLSFIGFILSVGFDSLLLESLVLRRYLMVPALLNHYYYEFFQGNYLYYSHSFMNSVFEYPYELGPTYMVAEYAYGKTTTNANNGFISDAFMNFGYVGVVIYTFLVGMIIKLFDKLSIDAKFFGLFFLLINLFRSSGLATIILTHGLWLFILLAYFVLRNTGHRHSSIKH